jgi:hypothetical protein
VDAGRVLDHLKIDAAEAQLLDGVGAVREQPLAVRWIDPRARHDLGAVVRPDVLLVGADDAVDRVAGDELLLHQQGLERADAEGQQRLRLAVVMAMLVAVFVRVVGGTHVVLLAGAAGSRYRSHRSMWTFARGSAEAPQRTSPSKRTL